MISVTIDSPNLDIGALLIDRITDQLFAGPDTMAINSCAAEASFMAHLWAGRRIMVDMLVDIGAENRWSIEWKPAGSLVIRSAQLAGSAASASPPKKLGLASPRQAEDPLILPG
jgi:hypothetical protein